jgi:uncharacterized protein YraI
MATDVRYFWLPLVTLLLAITGCSAATGDPDSEELVGAPETVESRSDGLSGYVAVGSTLRATANVNLRNGPGTTYTVLRVIADGSTVTNEASTPLNGFYRVKHNGTLGWAYGAYFQIASGGSDDSSSDAPSSVRAAAITRARAAKGFSYWWGHGRFRTDGVTSATAGSCSGSCPDCSHGGSYGGDCSGLAAKVWRVPSSNTDLSDDEHPYTTANFNSDTSQWSSVPRANVKQADAMVYRQDGSGHIFIYDSGDGWNQMYAYECKGCSYGCIGGYRTASSAFHAIRRAGW